MGAPTDYKDTDRILVRTNYRGYIPEMSMAGPVTRPLLVPVKTVISMIMHGMQLYQVEKATGKSVLLTLQNVKDSTKFMDKVEKDTKVFKVGKDMTTEVVGGVTPPEVPTEPAPLSSPKAEEAPKSEPVDTIPATPETPVEQNTIDPNHLTKAQRRELRRQEAAKTAEPSEATETTHQ